MVGYSGSEGTRAPSPTASARSFPARTWGSTVGMLLNASDTSPASNAVAGGGGAGPLIGNVHQGDVRHRREELAREVAAVAHARGRIGQRAGLRFCERDE